MSAPRVALFTDCYLETNGVSLTMGQLESYARRKRFPFLLVHGGPELGIWEVREFKRLQLDRGWASFRLERDFRIDPLLWRHRRSVRLALEEFRPDLIHVTSTGDIGMLGTYLAAKMKVPLVAAWHTNTHEYAGQRLSRMLPFLPRSWRRGLAGKAEAATLELTLRLLYRRADLILAPTAELREWLMGKVDRPVHLMRRGTDTVRFHPSRRRRSDRTPRLGFVGRLSPEKNLRLLARVEQELVARGIPFRFVIVGDGGERAWLEANLRNVECTGVLKGDELARAYADMDLFVFPSRTDTYGNAVVEALASGVPAVVTDSGGPKSLVRHGISGWIASSDEEFVEGVVALLLDPQRLRAMREAAPGEPCIRSWDAVFDGVYESYRCAAEETVSSLAPSLTLGFSAGNSKQRRQRAS